MEILNNRQDVEVKMGIKLKWNFYVCVPNYDSKVSYWQRCLPGLGFINVVYASSKIINAKYSLCFCEAVCHSDDYKRLKSALCLRGRPGDGYPKNGTKQHGVGVVKS